MNELKVIKQQLPEIVLNFDEMKAGIEEKLEKFSGLIVTEETLKDCKDVQQELSRTRRDIDGKRLEIQREIKKPLDEFNSQMKELTSMVCAVEEPIKKGMQVFEDKRIEDKTNIIKGMIMELVIGYKLRPEFAEIEIDKLWLNKGYKPDDIKDSVESIAVASKVRQDARDSDLLAIGGIVDGANKTMATPLDVKRYEQMIVAGSPLSDVIASINMDSERTRKAEENALQVAEDAKRKAAEQPDEVPLVQEAKKAPEKSKELTRRTVSFSITDTEPRIKALGEFMKQNGFAWTKI